MVLVAGLSKDTVNNVALLQLDLISKILCLTDCADNSSNCGQVGEKAMIVDFRIKTSTQGYVKADILDKFYEGNSEFHYTGLMKAAVGTPNDAKMEVIKKSLEEWNLLQNIERAELEIDELVQNYDGKITFENDLKLYVKDIKATVEALIIS